MIIAVMILILSTAMFFFYLQSVAERILRQVFDREYFRTIVAANRLEFPFVKEAVAQFGAHADYSRFRLMLQCDYLALAYMLRQTAKPRPRLMLAERVLIWNFRITSLIMSAKRFFGGDEKEPMLHLTRILEYFANVLGKRAADSNATQYLGADCLANL